MGGIADAVGDLIVNAQHDVQSTNGGLVASLHQTATHSLTTHLTPMTPLTNHVRTSAYGLLGVSFDVVQVPVTLSCSTTLDGDSRRQHGQTEDNVFELQVSTSLGVSLLAIEDTTAPTTVVLQPGRYSLFIQDKTTRFRTDSNAGDELFVFEATGECHRVPYGKPADR